MLGAIYFFNCTVKWKPVLHGYGNFSKPSTATGPYSTERVHIFIWISALPSPVSLSLSTSIFVFPEREALHCLFRFIFSLIFFPLPLYHNLELKQEPSNVQTWAEPWKRWYLSVFEIRQNEFSFPSFKCLGEDVNLLTEIWGLTSIFKRHRIFLHAMCAVFGILSHCRRISCPTAGKVSGVERARTELIVHLGLLENIVIL